MVFSVGKMLAEDVIIKTEVEVTTYAHEDDNFYKNVNLQEAAEESHFDHNEVSCNTEPIHVGESKLKTEISIEDESTCSSCGQTFSKFSEVLKHSCRNKKTKTAQTTQQQKLHTCHVCGKTFQMLGNLNRHIIIHSGEKPYACEVCKKQFADQSTLRRHIKGQHAEKRFKCEECGRLFRAEYLLQRHIVVHADEKPYVCDLCKKRFAYPLTLHRHLKTHGEKRFKCEMCARVYSDESILQAHIKTHSKKYECQTCGKTLRCGISNYQDHVRSHKGETPYYCTQCNKAFSFRTSFARHIKSKIHKKMT